MTGGSSVESESGKDAAVEPRTSCSGTEMVAQGDGGLRRRRVSGVLGVQADFCCACGLPVRFDTEGVSSPFAGQREVPAIVQTVYATGCVRCSTGVSVLGLV
jgi:hypothetical protein